MDSHVSRQERDHAAPQRVRTPAPGVNPIEFLSTKPEDNLLAPILGQQYPLPYLVVDSATRKTVNENALYFLNKGLNLAGLYVAVEQPDGFRKYLGSISNIRGETLKLLEERRELPRDFSVPVEIGIYRPSVGKEPLHPRDSRIFAVACDQLLPEAKIRRRSQRHLRGCGMLLLQSEPLDAVVARLGSDQ